MILLPDELLVVVCNSLGGFYLSNLCMTSPQLNAIVSENEIIWSKFLKKNTKYAKLFYVTIYKRLRFVVVNLRIEYVNNIVTLRRYITSTREKVVIRKWDLFELLITTFKYGTRHDAIDIYNRLMIHWESAMNYLHDKDVDSQYSQFDDWQNLKRSRRRLKYLFKMGLACACHLED